MNTIKLTVRTIGHDEVLPGDWETIEVIDKVVHKGTSEFDLSFNGYYFSTEDPDLTVDDMPMSSVQYKTVDGRELDITVDYAERYTCKLNGRIITSVKEVDGAETVEDILYNEGFDIPYASECVPTNFLTEHEYVHAVDAWISSVDVKGLWMSYNRGENEEILVLDLIGLGKRIKSQYHPWGELKKFRPTKKNLIRAAQIIAERDEPDKTYHYAHGRRCMHNVTIYQ